MKYKVRINLDVSASNGTVTLTKNKKLRCQPFVGMLLDAGMHVNDAKVECVVHPVGKGRIIVLAECDTTGGEHDSVEGVLSVMSWCGWKCGEINRIPKKA